MNRGRLVAYLLRYQLADFLLLRAGLPGLVVVLFGFMLWKQTGQGNDWNSPLGMRFANEMFKVLAGIFITLGSFMGVARLVADDRSNGFFRFYFSKPVGIERYYVQQWLLNGIGMMVLTGLLGLWFQAGTVELPVRSAVIMMGLTWLLIGGLGFAVTAATNSDAAVIVLGYVVTTVLHVLKDTPNSPMWPWLKQVTRLTPPLQKLDYIRDQLYAGNAIPWPHFWHVAGYGALGFILAIVILRRTSFAR